MEVHVQKVGNYVPNQAERASGQSLLGEWPQAEWAVGRVGRVRRGNCIIKD